MDVMLNGWLLYQTLSCRFWARSGFLSGQADCSFRDQLQDGMALGVRLTISTREHLLRAAARQFVESNVQHWWLQHFGQGVRHPHLRRLCLAGLCSRPLCRCDRRLRHPR